METTILILLVSLLVGAFVLGYFTDWFGLWVGKEEKRKRIDKSEARMRGLEK